MKPLELQIFRSRVARRVFVLFVLAALIPLASTGVLALQRIGQAVTGAVDRQLSDVSRGYGQMIYRRLLMADRSLSRVPSNLAAFDPARDQPPEFDALAVFEEGRWTPVFGDLDLTMLNGGLLRQGLRSSVWVSETSRGSAVLIGHSTAAGALLIGRAAPDYLWDEYTLPYEHDVCVLSAATPEPLFCTAPLDASRQRALVQAGSPSSGTMTWEDGERRYRSAFWELFIQSGFEGAPWRIVAFVDDSIALASVNSFKTLFPITLLIVLVTVLLLSIWQIRRSMVPLDLLVEGTQRIANNEFDRPVRLQRKDEFGDLAEALNRMATRLGQQFATFNTLAEIDRLILSAGDIEQVLQAALARARTVLPCAAAGILAVDKQSPDMGQLYFMSFDREQQIPDLSRVTTTEIDQSFSSREPGAFLMNAREANLLDAFSAAGLEQVLVFPVWTNQAFAGALLLGFSDRAAVNVEDSQAGRDLADRLAVAMSASEREAMLFKQAHFDPLTGLPNRQLCRDRLHQALAQARRSEHELAVLFLDLDSFKTINDSLGHSAGDLLLREVASRLLTCMRDTDTVARLGGDEFVVILPQVIGVTEIETVATKVMAALRRAMFINGREVFVTASIGVTKYPDDGDTVEGLLQKADAAMYDAKAAGRSRYVFFTNEIEERATERLSLESDLRVALERGELTLRYQPLLDLATEQVHCAEVLLRWTHPTRGLVAPDLFVPLLEEMGLIDAVGEWVLSTALKQLRQWLAEGLPLRKLAINVSAQQLRQRQFPTRVLEILHDYGISPKCLEIEITESVFLEDMDQSNASLRGLRDAGVQVSIDDFGTGYSSFSYLRDLQFDAVKIDRAFVKDLPDRQATAIAKAIAAVARTLGKSVTAEGVETEIQLARLRSLGIDAAQGFLISRPLTADYFSLWLTKTVAGEDLSPSFIGRAIA